MTPREELDLILRLIRKYNLPLSPILEYAVNEKKDEYPEEKKTTHIVPKPKEEKVIEHVSKPAPVVEEPKIVKPKQVEDYYYADPAKKKPTTSSSSFFTKDIKTYEDVANGPDDLDRLEAVLKAMEHFNRPVTPRDVARTISRSLWGSGNVKEDTVDSILKRLPEVEYIPWGQYILKSKKI